MIENIIKSLIYLLPFSQQQQQKKEKKKSFKHGSGIYLSFNRMLIFLIST